MPIGIKIFPNFAQLMIEWILDGLDIDAYIDNLGIWTKSSFDDGMKCKLLKYRWVVEEENMLGHYIMMPNRITPMQNQIGTILKVG